MNDSYQQEILEYFRRKASAYDDVEKQAYWRLSDDLLWMALNDAVLCQLPRNFHFLDAGGGTGRWSEKVLQQHPHATGTIRDISEAMLEQARWRQQAFGANRLNIVQGSIEQMDDVGNSQFDLVFNFHNVIGFLRDPQHAVQEMDRVLKPGGFLVTVAPNLYHMAFFSIQIGQLNNAMEAVETGAGRFTIDMPVLKVFTPESLRNMYARAGLERVQVIGFPKLIFPGFLETQLEGNTPSHARLLEQPANMEAILAIEHRVLYDEEAAARGNNLLVIGCK